LTHISSWSPESSQELPPLPDVREAAYHSRSSTPLDTGSAAPRSAAREPTRTPFGYSTESRAGFKKLPDPTGSWSRPSSRQPEPESRPRSRQLEPWQQTLRSSFPRVALPEHAMLPKERLFLQRSQERWAALNAGTQVLPAPCRPPPVSGTGLWASAPL
jgi:hypothetical protein